MVRSILVGLDGSTFSEAAVELGLNWAKRFDCLLVGVGVVDEPTIRAPRAVPLGGGAFKTGSEEAQLAAAHQRVEQALAKFSHRANEVNVATKQLANVGVPNAEISREAQRYDLVLLGQDTFFEANNTERPDETLFQVLHNCPRPVVAVPEQLGSGNGVLVAYDGSVQSARALQAFVATGLHTPEKVWVLTLDRDSSVEAAKTAERAVEYLSFHGANAESIHLQTSSPPSMVILEQAQEQQAGLVVMGCYGRSRFAEFFLGSTTKKILGNSDVPILLYH